MCDKESYKNAITRAREKEDPKSILISLINRLFSNMTTHDLKA